MRTAWDLCRVKSGIQGFSSWVWNHLVPIKWSLFLWTALKGRIPLDDVLQARGIQLASQCSCCDRPSSESNEHVFISSGKAKAMWAYFEDKMGIQSIASLHTKFRLPLFQHASAGNYGNVEIV